MTDEEFIFSQTSRERKRIAAGAYHKKGGAKSKKCSLPSDRLTPKQLRGMNSEVETYKLGKPMGWIEFFGMPEDLKLEYLTQCIEVYGARSIDLDSMFEVGRGYTSAYIKRHFPDMNFFKRQGAPKVQSKKWLDFIGTSEMPSENVEIQEVNLPTTDAEAQHSESSGVKHGSNKLNVISGAIKYSGTPALIFHKALVAMDVSAEYEIEIHFKLLRDDKEAEPEKM